LLPEIEEVGNRFSDKREIENNDQVLKLENEKKALEQHILLADTTMNILKEELEECIIKLQHEVQSKENLLIERKEKYDEEQRISEDLLFKSELEKKKLRDDLAVLKLQISEKEGILKSVMSELQSKDEISENMHRDLASSARQSNQKDSMFALENDLLTQKIETEKEELRNEISMKNNEISELKKLFVLKEKNEAVESKVSAIGTEKKIEELQEEVTNKAQYGNELNKSLRDIMKINNVIKNALKESKKKESAEPQILTPTNDDLEIDFDINNNDARDISDILVLKNIQIIEMNQKLALYAKSQQELKSAVNDERMERDQLLEKLKASEKQRLLLKSQLEQNVQNSFKTQQVYML
jgi:hypothetical protein